MGFHEIPRYNIICDTPKCHNVFGFIEFDLDNKPIDHYVFETTIAELSQAMIDELYRSQWTVIDGHTYCPMCTTSVTNNVIAVLKADMGY